METTMVDYAKYANMNARQLVNSLMTLERKEEKYREEVKNKLRDMQELAYFLKTKIKESLDSPKFVSRNSIRARIKTYAR